MEKGSEIEYKLTQALLVWKEQGGAKSISISDAINLSQRIKPGITESELRSIVNSSSSLELNSNEIVLSKNLTNLM